MRSICLFLSILVVTISLYGCGLSATSSDCDPGKTCTCNQTGACSLDCTGVGCNFECSGLGSCNLTCTEGGCTAVNNGKGALILLCPGGNCAVTCASLGSCTIKSCQDCTCTQTGQGVCYSK
jgi:hypothetical protein